MILNSLEKADMDTEWVEAEAGYSSKGVIAMLSLCRWKWYGWTCVY